VARESDFQPFEIKTFPQVTDLLSTMGFYVSVFKLCESTEQTDRQTDWMQSTVDHLQDGLHKSVFTCVETGNCAKYTLLPVSRDLWRNREFSDRAEMRSIARAIYDSRTH